LEKPVLLGEIAGAFGIHGWVKIHSYTDPVANILKYVPWYLENGGQFIETRPLSGKQQGTAVVALFEGITDRDAAALMRGRKIWVERKTLPEPAAGEYYWADLVGLKVKTVEQFDLGVIVQMMATGANDIMVIRGEREHLVPFVKDRFVIEVNKDSGEIIVDWDPDF
jgi:16S rRNA processing protein RimM